MTYTVHSIFKTIQGEGRHTGRVAVFCRFAGCNLWSGREKDRAAATCKFCDTEFVGGTKYQTAKKLADAIENAWDDDSEKGRFVVLTGGEPALQFDLELWRELKSRRFYIAIETNGTLPLLAIPDWICVSPKAHTKIAVEDADELKLVFPQRGLSPKEATTLLRAHYYSIQPMDGPRLRENVADAIEFVLDNPKWRLGIQAHKHWGIA